MLFLHCFAAFVDYLRRHIFDASDFRFSPIAVSSSPLPAMPMADFLSPTPLASIRHDATTPRPAAFTFFDFAVFQLRRHAILPGFAIR
jgi:hypothetical protein